MRKKPTMMRRKMNLAPRRVRGERGDGWRAWRESGPGLHCCCGYAQHVGVSMVKNCNSQGLRERVSGTSERL